MTKTNLIIFCLQLQRPYYYENNQIVNNFTYFYKIFNISLKRCYCWYHFIIWKKQSFDSLRYEPLKQNSGWSQGSQERLSSASCLRSFSFFFNALLQMLFNLGRITRSPVQILDLCSKFESFSIILPSQDRNAWRKYFKVTSLARSGFFLEQLVLLNYILFKSKGKLGSLPAYNIRPLYHDNGNQQEMVLEQELLLLQCLDNLISLNSHEETIILRECLGRLNIPLIKKGWRWYEFSIISENMNQIQWRAILVIEAKSRSNLAIETILKNLI
ncbi:Hypothetical_protein [Hexamita inflata]|uniref:Hypothetical_protein n=1 Tax=Hexamita inflata TaxID=28002 RepID=A0AA86UL25_9EUKA|nr:Hypothetical protein HINF_LOCUS43097 [Hexamita inflata]CAI9957159.1 Hypothetical protein HINF_LOCUS44804 [Hexamita inflata]